MRSIVWRRLGVCLAWGCFIFSCALWVWAVAPRGPSASFRLSDPDGGMIPKPPTAEENAQMVQVNREFAEFLSEVEENQKSSKEGKILAVGPPSVSQNSPAGKSKVQTTLLTNFTKGGSK